MEKDTIQSIIFNKEQWTEKQAKKWLEKHGYTTNYKGKGTDIKTSSYRFRQHEPLSSKAKSEGYHYITAHPKGNASKGIAYVIIKPPKHSSETQPKIHKDAQSSGRKLPKLIDMGDQLTLLKSQGMFNMPIELGSTVGHISDGDPMRHLYKHLYHHPTLETAKLIDYDLFSNLALQNY